MLNWFSQVAAVAKFGLSSLPQRRGSAAAAVFGIAGVVGVLVGVLSMAAGFRRTMAASSSPDSAIVLRSGAMYDGSHVNLKGTRTATARSVRLEPARSAAGPVDVEADGELIGRLPATFTVVPGALRLVS